MDLGFITSFLQRMESVATGPVSGPTCHGPTAMRAWLLDLGQTRKKSVEHRSNALATFGW
jgi:hypothetical protein